MATNGLRRRRNTGDSKNNANTMTADEYATQHDLFGPISGALLVDPVRIRATEAFKKAAPGAYERAQITRWINLRGTSPTNSNRRITVADLEPAHDKQKEIREFVKKYPDAQIVKDWLREQPPWYTQAIQRIRNTGAPVVQAMSRVTAPVRQVMPSADTCLRCCAKTAETGAGAVVGAGVGACTGCACAMGLSAETEDSTPLTDEEKAALMTFMTPTGAAVGALVGAVLGPEECLKCAGEACRAACENQGRYGGKRKRKTRKGKRKKKRKTRKRRRKRTIKKKRRRRGRKSRKR